MLATSPAHAQVDRAAAATWSHPSRHDGEVSLDVRDYWLRAMPSFSEANLPSTGDQHFVGIGVDTKYIYEQRYEFPIFGLVGASSVGMNPRLVATADGGLVDMRPAGAITFLLPGVGLRFKARRWMFGANVRFIGTFIWEQVSFVGPQSNDTSANTMWASTFGARAHVEVCRRLDPSDRLCLFVEPHLYEFGGFNGASAGLRWEIGR